MSRAHHVVLRRKSALAQIDRLMQEPSIVLVVHYSCEALADRTTGLSPRVASISILNLGSGQTHSFSVHQVAERKGMDAATIPDNFGILERELLDTFYAYVDRHTGYWWVHWNMRDSNYGFLALEHRYQVLGGNPKDIPEARRLDLAAYMHDIFGSRYAAHPRLTSLVKLNSITDRDFLNGNDEAKAFHDGNYPQLHLSTLRKVDVIATVLQLVWDDRLKTEAPWQDRFGNSVLGFIEVVSDHWIFKVLGFIGIVASLLGVWLTLHTGWSGQGSVGHGP